MCVRGDLGGNGGGKGGGVGEEEYGDSSLLTDPLFRCDTCLSLDLAEIGLLLGDKCLNNLYLTDIGLLRGDVRLKDLDLMDIGLLGVGLFRGVSFLEIDLLGDFIFLIFIRIWSHIKWSVLVLYLNRVDAVIQIITGYLVLACKRRRRRTAYDIMILKHLLTMIHHLTMLEQLFC